MSDKVRAALHGGPLDPDRKPEPRLRRIGNRIGYVAGVVGAILVFVGIPCVVLYGLVALVLSVAP